MKDHVAIIGGFAAGGGWGRTGTTTFSGDIGNEGSTSDNSYKVFSHDSIPLDNGLLYGVTITGGNGSTGGGMYNDDSSPRLVEVVFSDNSATLGGGLHNDSSSPRLVDVEFVSNSSLNEGGGMYNTASSPVLVDVRFTGNSAKGIAGSGGGMNNRNSSSPRLVNVEFTGNSAVLGGGMYNIATSSPVLTRVEFAGNIASDRGGGMYNSDSSPVLRGVVFSSNSSGNLGVFGAAGGGGMYNIDSSPVLRGVVFIGNSAKDNGGGMFNFGTSSPVLVGAVFRGNSAKNNGGGMYSYNIKTGAEPVIVNSIFVSNSATTGKDIVFDRNGAGNNIKVRVAGSVLGVGKVNVTNGIVVTNTGSTGGSYNITHHSLATGEVNFGADRTTSTATGGLTYPTIQGSSSAINVGLYVQRKDSTYYFSDTGTGTSWHTNFTATGGLAGTAGALPSGTEDLTATDIAGNARVGRPDAGVYEYTP